MKNGIAAIINVLWNMAYAWRHKEHLGRGVFYLLPNMRTLVKEDLRPSLKEIFPAARKSRKRAVLYAFAKMLRCRNRQDGKTYTADAVYFSNTNRNSQKVIKFFDFKNKQVLSICQNKQDYASFIQNRSGYANYYRVPALIRCDHNKLEYVEEYIEKCPYEFIGAYHTLLQIYIESFRKQQPVQEENRFEKPDLLIGQQIECPRFVINYLQHGDLSVDNFICLSEEIVFIDFEHQGQYPLFYDIFFLAVNEYVINYHTAGIEWLLHQNTRNRMEEVCSLFGMTLLACFTVFVQVFYENRLKAYIGSDVERRYRALFAQIFGSLSENGSVSA